MRSARAFILLRNCSSAYFLPRICTGSDMNRVRFCVFIYIAYAGGGAGWKASAVCGLFLAPRPDPDGPSLVSVPPPRNLGRKERPRTSIWARSTLVRRIRYHTWVSKVIDMMDTIAWVRFYRRQFHPYREVEDPPPPAASRNDFPHPSSPRRP